MNFQNDFNKVNSKIQEVFKNWDNKILPHLPQNTAAKKSCTFTGAAGRWSYCLSVSGKISPSIL